LTGERHISQQRAIVERQGHGGIDLVAARALLDTFEDLQREHVAHRHQLAKELAPPKPG